MPTRSGPMGDLPLLPLALALAAAACPLCAETGAVSRSPGDAETVAVATVSSAADPIHVDGRLDETSWQTAQPLATLTDRFLARPVRQATTFRLCYDRSYWYVAARCSQPGADQLTVTAREHDSATYSEDAVEVFLQPPGGDTYYHLAINMAGVVFDQRNGEGAGSWDAGCRVAVVRTSSEWVVEVAIPAAGLWPEDLAPGQEWRIGLYRDDMDSAQYAAWSSVADGGWHQTERFGRVHLVPRAQSGRPAVNVIPSGPVVRGTNTVALQVHGPIDTAGCALSLAVVPALSSRLPADAQDAHPMDPAWASVPWPDPPGRTVQATCPLARLGAAHLVATLRDRSSGRILSRAVSSVVLAPGGVAPVRLSLRQPYVTTETELPLEIAVRPDLGGVAGASIRLSVRDASGTSVHAAQLDAVAGSLQAALPVAQLALGRYAVRAEVVSAGGEILAAAEAPLTRHEPFGETSHVRVDADGRCYVDGRPMLPLGFLLASPDSALVEAGYDVAMYGGETLEGRNQMDVAAERGVRVMPHICNYLRGNGDFDAIRAVVSLRRTEPALFAWYLADEPEGYGDTPEVLRQAYAIIKSIDPDHPVVVLTNAPGMLQRYDGCADVIMADPYPIPLHPLSQVAEWTDACLAAARAHGQAAWMTPQGFGWSDIGDSDAPSPTREELSNMLHTCLIHGAGGILWWPYATPRSNYWPHFRKMARECRFMEPWLVHGEEADGLPAGVQVQGDVHWRAWQHEGRVLVLAANLARQSRPLQVPVPQGVRSVSCPFDPDQEAALPRAADGTLGLMLAPVQTLALVMERGR